MLYVKEPHRALSQNDTTLNIFSFGILMNPTIRIFRTSGWVYKSYQTLDFTITYLPSSQNSPRPSFWQYLCPLCVSTTIAVAKKLIKHIHSYHWPVRWPISTLLRRWWSSNCFPSPWPLNTSFLVAPINSDWYCTVGAFF